MARQAYAAAAAQVAKGAPTEVLGRVVEELLERYVSDDGGVEDGIRLAVGGMARELLRVATDAMMRVRTDWLPLLFLGKHEPRSQVEQANAPTAAQKEEKGKLAALWNEVYDEAGVGPSLLTLHLPEIMALLTRVVNGPSWALRRAAAYGLIELESVVPAASLERHPKEKEQMGRLAAVLTERKWRDKEGDALKAIEKMGAPFALPPGSGDAEDAEEPKAADPEADSGDF